METAEKANGAMNEIFDSRNDDTRAFKIGVTLNAGFIILEAVFGLVAGSLALLADAGHNLSDLLGLLMAWGASYLARRKATEKRTYGWRKSTILAALFNAVFLMMVIGAIGWEAVHRFMRPATVAGGTVIWVAAVGVAINGLTALLFMAGRKRDLNIQGAFLHMAADAGVSAGVVVVGVGMMVTGWMWLDPLVSLLIVAIIFIGTWGLLKESFNLALDAVPRHIDAGEVKDYLAGRPEILHIRDLHIWGMSTTEVALTAHMEKAEPSDGYALIEEISRDLKDRFGIGHATIQWEKSGRTHF